MENLTDSKTPGIDSLINRKASSRTYLSRKGSHKPKKDDDDDDDDLETVLDLTEKREPYDLTGQTVYMNACDRYKTVPSTKFHKKLQTSTEVDLKYYGMGAKGALALSIPMVINTKISSLNLRGNFLGVDGIDNICRMMEENSTITELDLGENKLGHKGARIVGHMLLVNQTLQRLSLDDNGLTDQDAHVLTGPIEDHSSLTYVNFSHNAFSSDGGFAFKKMIAENGILEELDFSWNQIRGPGAMAMVRGLKDNNSIKVFNIAWNGLQGEGAVEMAQALKATRTIKEVDISSNRVSSEGFLTIMKALKENDTLATLKIGKNPITEDAAVAGLDLLMTFESLNLESLQLIENIYTSKFNDKIAEVKEIHENFNCIHGYAHSYGQRKMKSFDVVDEAMSFLKDYIAERNISLVELFATFDEDGSMSVTYDEFREGLKMARIPLTDIQVESLIHALDQDGDGEIDFSELVIGAEEHDQGKL